MIPTPESTDVADLADWIELCSLKSARARISRSDIVGQLQESGVADPEEKCEFAWNELVRRQRALEEGYPFVIADSAVTRARPWRNYVAYTTFVLISSAPLFRESRIRDYCEIAKLFERTVSCAIQTYIGGRAERIGHPRDAPVPSNFEELLKYLADTLGEGLRRSKPLIRETKDCRADIIAWRPFSDHRGGQLVVFAQCAIGANWISKLTELDVRIWQRYIEFVVEPVRAFAVPFVEPNEDKWLEYGTSGGIALDRIRLVEMLTAGSIPRPLLLQLKRWSSRQLELVPWER